MEASRSRSSGVKKGAWTAKEDSLLKKCIQKYGEGSWHRVPARAGLNRCRKSCRLRWINYLNPQIKQGEFCSGEIDLMIKMHKLLGNRWSLIAGRLPGRTANGIKNYWKTHIDRRLSSQCTNQMNTETVTPKQLPIKPKPHTLSKNFRWVGSTQMDGAAQSSETPRVEWLESILFREEDEKETYAVTSAEEDFIRSFCLDGIQLPEPDGMNQEGASEWNDLCLDFDLWEKRNFNEQLL